VLPRLHLAPHPSGQLGTQLFSASPTKINTALDSKMSPKTFKASLPPEIVHHIVNSLITPAAASAIALPASDPITKTLYSLTHTCRTTYAIATRLLYSHCLFIDSEAKLSSLLVILHRAGENTSIDNLSELRPSLLQHVTSLFLGPGDFRPAWGRFNPSCTKITDLIAMVSPHLKRIVINYDFYDAPPFFGDARSHLIQDTFPQLTSLEVFCSLQDGLHTNIRRPSDNLHVWSHWPKLKKLVLWEADIHSEEFWEEVGLLKDLKELVLIHQDEADVMEIRRKLREVCAREKVLSVIFVDVLNCAGENWKLFREGWDERPHISINNVTTPKFNIQDENNIGIVQDWVSKMVVGGEDFSTFKL
jgi:hypothetical protein